MVGSAGEHKGRMNKPQISAFRHGLECIMPRYTRLIHSRPWWNVHISCTAGLRFRCWQYPANQTSKYVATPCADTYAVVRLAVPTSPLHCAVGKAAGTRASQPAARDPQAVNKDVCKICVIFWVFPTRDLDLWPREPGTPPWERFTPISVFLHLFAFQLKTLIRQTYERTNKTGNAAN